MLYPFIDAAAFAAAVPQIEAALRRIAPFALTLREFGVFEHRGCDARALAACRRIVLYACIGTHARGRSQTVWLRPESEPPHALRTLHRALAALFPHCDDLDHKSSDGYTPHVTVGQLRGKLRGDATRRLVGELQAAWRPLTVAVTHIELLARQDDTPFAAYYALPLGVAGAGRPAPALRSATSEQRRAACRFDAAARGGVGEWRAIDAPALAKADDAGADGFAGELSVVSYNVLFDTDDGKAPFDATALESSARLPCVLQLLERSRADIICLQEVTPTILAALLASDWVQRSYHVSEISGEGVSPYSQVTLARFPFQCSVLPFSSVKRAVLARMLIGARSLCICNVHLPSSVGKNGATRRQKQLELLSELSRKDDACDHFLICGDTNLEPDEDGWAALDEFDDAWVAAGLDGDSDDSATFCPARNATAAITSMRGLARRCARAARYGALQAHVRALQIRSHFLSFCARRADAHQRASRWHAANFAVALQRCRARAAAVSERSFSACCALCAG